MNICVFSSSSNGIADLYFEAARELGSLIGSKGHILVNGGANVGLMEAVTLAAKNAGGKTVGIIPEKMRQRSLVSDHSHKVIITEDMQERKARMREISDAFIALPGGFGTLEEILEIITLKQLAYHNKAVVYVNTNNYFGPLFEQFEKSFAERFAKEDYRQLYFITESPEEAIRYIETNKPIEQPLKWFKVPEK